MGKIVVWCGGDKNKNVFPNKKGKEYLFAMTTERKELGSITHSLFKCQESSKMYRGTSVVNRSLGLLISLIPCLLHSCCTCSGKEAKHATWDSRKTDTFMRQAKQHTKELHYYFRESREHECSPVMPFILWGEETEMCLKTTPNRNRKWKANPSHSTM